jgi:uncharacterized RDD family membrane protein YckC
MKGINMKLYLQKASILKRISAYILDFIVLVICITGFATLFSTLFGYDNYNDTLERRQEAIEAEYGVDFEIKQEDYEKLTQKEKDNYSKAEEAYINDDEAKKAWNVIISLILTIISLSILLAHIIAEFLIPMYFGNGQTIGKKVFALGVMRSNHVKISNQNLFIRSVLGKCTIEAMVPVLLVIMIFSGILGIVGTAVLGLILLLQICLLIFTSNNSVIHDILSDTVVIDMSSQLIFDTEEAMIEYIKKHHKEQVEGERY